MDDLKYLVPVATFALGVFATPYLEGLKLRFKVNQLKRDVSTELNEEFVALQKAIRTVDKSIKTRENSSPKFIHISLSAPNDFIILEKHFIDIYGHLTSPQRMAYKRIMALNKRINDKRDLVSEKFKEDNWECLAHERTMLYEMLSMYYIMSNLLQSKEHFSFPTKGNDDVVKDAATALNVNFPL